MLIDEFPIDENVDKTIVLMMTCKKYEQLWNPFFTLFKRFWPECPYKLIMGTDEGEYLGIETIKVGFNVTNK